MNSNVHIFGGIFVVVVVVGKTIGFCPPPQPKIYFSPYLINAYINIVKNDQKFVDFLGNFGSVIRKFGQGMWNAHESILHLFEFCGIFWGKRRGDDEIAGIFRFVASVMTLADNGLWTNLHWSSCRTEYKSLKFQSDDRQLHCFFVTV